MTEAEWLDCVDPAPMLEFIRGKGKDRKLRLFACACVRQIWRFFPRERRDYFQLLVAERFADGLATLLELKRAEKRGGFRAEGQTIATDAHLAATYAALRAAREVADLGRPDPWENGEFMNLRRETAATRRLWQEQLEKQCKVLRECFGNPFRPVAIDPRWKTSTVVDLTRTIYDGGGYDRMPILADALMDAGCDCQPIIDHCRQPAEHVRGCWVIDLVTGKE